MHDPNKYAKNKKLKPDSKLSDISAIASVLLMLIGLIGLGVELFKDDGLFQSGFKHVFQSAENMLIIPVVLLGLWIFSRFTASPQAGELKKSGNIPMYIMMLIGAYYIFRLVTTGGF